MNTLDLRGKKLLLMGGGAYAKGIQKYKEEKGFGIVTLGKDKDTPISRIADSFYNIDTQDVDAVVEVVKKEKVDGIFVGSSEVNINPAIDVAARTGIHFYVNREQWDIISNKAQFKQIARKYGFPVIPEFSLSENPTDEEIEKLDYPLMIKPTDSSGARGMNPCYRKEDFRGLYEEALRWSKKKEVIVEKLVTGAKEVFVNYTIQDGEATLAYSFTKFQVNAHDNKTMVPLFHMYPSRYTDEYCEKVDASAKRMIGGLGLKDGTLTLQGFYKDGEFYFFEAGYRMGGAQAYILTDFMNGANVLEYMINYALTGKMSEERIAEKENVHFKYPCCNYYVVLKPGLITKIIGLDEVERLSGVLNVTQMVKEGDHALDTNALERVGFRIHVYGESNEILANNLVRISSTLQVMSDKGEEMQLEPLTFERCMSLIESK